MIETHSRTRFILLRPFQEFFRQEASGGILLLACAVAAILWANSPYSAAYFDLWSTYVTVGPEGYDISKPLLLWINDGLMAIFFFVVGLEIKREVLVGELASPRKAALPMAGALGGVLIPAGIYAALNLGTPGEPGWGVPMATDIAFALGVLALLGSRAPLALKIFLTALAIVDDLVAVLVIALFYTAQISWLSLSAGAVCLILLVIMNRAGVRRPLIYILLGMALWVAFLKSGVHATIAGVLLAMTIPARRRIDAREFLERARGSVDAFARDMNGEIVEPTADQRDAIYSLEMAVEGVETPLARMEHFLHPWVAFFIIPVFALANAGVALTAGTVAAIGSSISLGIILGLIVGKQIGVTLFSWIAVRMGWAEMPAGITWMHIYGVSWLCGIGFTMSLFIAALAFPDPELLDQAKIGILSASLVAGVVGWLLLRNMARK